MNDSAVSGDVTLLPSIVCMPPVAKAAVLRPQGSVSLESVSGPVFGAELACDSAVSSRATNETTGCLDFEALRKKVVRLWSSTPSGKSQRRSFSLASCLDGWAPAWGREAFDDGETRCPAALGCSGLVSSLSCEL